MASITIRDLPESTKKSLRVQAAEAGISLEAYVRQILQKESSKGGTGSLDILNLAEHYFGSKHGVDLELPKLRSRRTPVDLAS